MAELPMRLDGSGSFLGMDSFSDPQDLAKNEYVAAMNVVSRGGIVQTRPGSRVLSCAPSHENLQGLCFFQPTGGTPSLVLAVDGSIYTAQAPFTSFSRLENIQFSPFSQYVSFATCLQSTDYDVNGVLYALPSPRSVLVMQDGQTRAAFWDGSTNRHLNPEPSPETPLWVTGAVLDSNGSLYQGWSVPVTVSSGTFVQPIAYDTQTTKVVYLRSETTPSAPTDAAGTGWSLTQPEDGVNQGYDETKIGLWMVWSNNRLWVSREGQVFASDIGNPLKFTEGQYLNEGRAFYLNDDCTGMVELTDQSGILVFTKDDATVIRSSITDRTQWLSTADFQKVLFQKVGCVAPRSIVVQYGLIWWFSAKGMINLDAALRQNLTSRLQLQDQEIIASKSNCSPDLSMICGAFYENYLLMSVPSGDVWNRHTWVLDQDPFPAKDAQINSWNSWWSGWRPVEWARGIVDGNERLFFLSRDFDGKGRVWESMLPERTDNGCPITCALQTREHNYGDMELKEFKMAETYLKEVYGSVAFMQAYRSTKGPWTRILTKQIEATAGQIYDDATYSETGNKFAGNRPQSRTLRSSEGLVAEIPCQADCGVESGQENKPANIDRAFSLLMVWSGRAGVYGYRIFSLPVTDSYDTGRCEVDETAPRSVAQNGASALSFFTSCNPFDEFDGSGSFTATNESCGGAQTFTASSSSIISQTDADNKAECAALTKAQCYADGQCGNPTFCNVEQTVTVSANCGNGIRVCDGNVPVQVVCESRTAETYLYGFSAYSSDAAPYDAMSPESWEGQYRKWSTRTFSGENTVIDYTEPGCSGDCVSQGNGSSEGGRFSGSAVINSSGVFTSYGLQEYVNSDCSPTTWFTGSTVVENIVSYKPESECSGYNDIYSTQTLLRRDNISCGCILNFITEEPGTRSYNGTMSAVISSERTVYSAMEDAGGVVGDSCVASVEFLSYTSPETTAPIPISGTPVKNTFLIGDVDTPLSVGETYTATVVIAKTPKLPGPVVLESVDIEFVAEGAVDSMEYFMPASQEYNTQVTQVTVVAGNVPCAGDVTASFTVPAGAFCSSSQVMADQLAYAYGFEQATAAANAQLSCIYPNEEQSFTAYCPGTLVEGGVEPPGSAIGTPSTATVFAGTFTADTQEAANALALAEAQAQAEAGLECFWTNTEQTAQFCCPSSVLVSGSGFSAVDDTYSPDGYQNGKPAYSVGDKYIYWDGAFWTIGFVDLGMNVTAYQSASDTQYPWEATWDMGPAPEPFPTVSEAVINCASSTVPFNTYNSEISQNDADTLAYAQAVIEAEASIVCTSDISDGIGEVIIL